MSPAFLPGNLGRNSGLSFQEAWNFFNSFIYEISSILSSKHWAKSLSWLVLSLKYPCLYPFSLNHGCYAGLYRVAFCIFSVFFHSGQRLTRVRLEAKTFLETDNPWWSSSTQLSTLRWFYPGLNYFDNLKDVRANCFCASLLLTTACANSHTTSCI